MDRRLIVDPEHFDYLRVQKGSLDYVAGNFTAWLAAYQADISKTFDQIAPWLPPTCRSLLDVGSGLGGIDVLIRRHYEWQYQDPPHVHLLDGIDDPPRVRLHRETFNNMYIARNFQVKNGLPPLNLTAHGTHQKSFAAPFDLVVSFGAWCFHLVPSTYLPALRAGGLHKDTVAILDVRSHKPEYFEQLEEVFQLVTMVELKEKFSRCVFRVKPEALV